MKSGDFLTSPLFERHGIRHGFGSAHAASHVFSKAEIVPETKQVHGSSVHFLADASHVYIGDAFLSDREGVVCRVRTADCLPLLLCDMRRGLVGAVHCGWRGISAHIVRNALEAMIGRGGDPQNIIAAIGPRIRQDCYRVREDVIGDFRKNGWRDIVRFAREKGGGYCLSMSKAVCIELAESGIDRSNIDILAECTYCRPELFHSHRRNAGGRQENYVVIANSNTIIQSPPRPSPVS